MVYFHFEIKSFQGSDPSEPPTFQSSNLSAVQQLFDLVVAQKTAVLIFSPFTNHSSQQSVYTMPLPLLRSFLLCSWWSWREKLDWIFGFGLCGSKQVKVGTSIWPRVEKVKSSTYLKVENDLTSSICISTSTYTKHNGKMFPRNNDNANA